MALGEKVWAHNFGDIYFEAWAFAIPVISTMCLDIYGKN